MRLPQGPDEISPEWVDTVLRGSGTLEDATVTRVQTEAIGEGRGYLSQTIRVRVEYDRPAPTAPASIVVKIEPSSGAFAEASRGVKAFEREIGFYRDVAPELPIRLPRIWYADTLAEGNVLVMEDLGRLEALDQVHGMRHEHVLATVRAIAVVHARYWNSEVLAGLRWLPDHDHFIDDGYAEHWPTFARAFELRIGREAVALGERVARHKDELEARICERAATLIHSDLRADNVLHDPATGEVVVIDWQLSTRSFPAIDPARLLGGSEPPAERRGHQLEVFSAWYEALIAAGVRDYAVDEALDDLRLAALYCLFIPVKIYSMVGPNPEGRGGRLLDCQSERFFAAAVELEAGRMLP